MKKPIEFEFPNMTLTTCSRLTRNQARKHKSHLWCYNNWCHRGANNFQSFHLGKITRNCYTPVICYHENNIGNYLIKPQSERHIIISIITYLSLSTDPYLSTELVCLLSPYITHTQTHTHTHSHIFIYIYTIE